MRVLFLTNIEVDRFGVAEILQHLAKSLATLDIDVLIASSDDSARAGTLPNGLACVHVPLPKPNAWLPSVQPLVELCRRERIELIHCHGLYRPGTAARLVKRRLGIPYVVTSHGDINPHGSDRIHRGNVRRRCAAILRDADAVTHNTLVTKSWADNLYDVFTKDAVIPNGVDLSWWHAPVVPMPGRYLLALGRFIPTKGFDLLLPTLRQLVDRGQDVSLVLAGEGPEQKALQEMAGTLGLHVTHHMEALAEARPGAVCFPGLIGGELKRRLFAGCQAVVFPSRPESPEALPLVLLEALAAGKAIVASRLPCVEALLTDGQHGLLVAPEADGFAHALQRLLRDDAVREQFAAGNLRESTRYDWPVIAEQYHKVYRRANYLVSASKRLQRLTAAELAPRLFQHH